MILFQEMKILQIFKHHQMLVGFMQTKFFLCSIMTTIIPNKSDLVFL